MYFPHALQRFLTVIKTDNSMPEKWAVGGVLFFIILICHWLLRKATVPVVVQKQSPRFRKRDKVVYYGRRILHSFGRYTSAMNKRRAMHRLARNFMNRRRKKQEVIRPVKNRQPPKFLLEYDTESSISYTSQMSTWPPEINYLLKNVKVFGHFEKPVIFHLCKFVSTKFVPAGSFLFKIGDKDENMFVVRKGLLQVFITDERRYRYSIKQCSEGDNVFSLISIADYLTGNYRRFENISCKAVCDSMVIILPFAAFIRVFEEFPESLVRFSQVIMLRFRRITFMTLHDYLGFTDELMNTVQDTDTVSESNQSIDQDQSTSMLSTLSEQQKSTKASDSDFQAAVSRANALDDISIYASRRDLDDVGDRSSDSDGSEYGSAERNEKYTDILEDVRNNIAFLLGIDKPELLDGLLGIYDVSKNTVLSYEGEYSEKVVYLIEGLIGAYCKPVDNSGKEKLMFMVNPKQFASILPVLTGEPALFTYRVKKNSLICAITKENIYGLLRNQPRIVLKLMQMKISRMSSFARRIDFGLEWMFIESGKALYRQGFKAENVYIILNGRVRSIVTSDDQKSKQLFGEYGRGETVGFIEVLMEIPCQSTAVAVRDTEMAQISSGLLNYIKTTYPVVLSRIMKLTSQSLYGNIRSVISSNTLSKTSDANYECLMSLSNKNLSTIAIFPISEETPIDAFSIELTRVINTFGPAVRLTRDIIISRLGPSALSPVNEHRLSAWLSQQEEIHRLVVYQCSSSFTPWTRRCVRQADCVLAVSVFWHDTEVSEIEKQVEHYAVRAQKELILLHRLEDGRKPKGTANWLRHRFWCSSHHHIRCPVRMFSHNYSSSSSSVESSASEFCDLFRLARFLTGRSLGLVLGGGGARGCSHVGIIKAMTEHNVPIDMVGGTSIGSFIGALYADDLDPQRCHDRAKAFSVKMSSVWKKVFDLTYPIVSMFTGSAFNEAIEEAFGDVQIEDLWIPYFCITTDVSVSKMRVHTSGLLWSYVRSSMSLSGYLPPLCDPIDGHLLVDGGYVNNLPADVMQKMGAYFVIAVDVGSQDESNFTNYGDSLSGWWLLWKRFNPWADPVKIPDMAEIQSRLAYVSCQRQLELVKNLARCEYVRPPIDRFGSLQFSSFDEIRDVGYHHGNAIFRGWVKFSAVENNFLLTNESTQKKLNSAVSPNNFIDLAEVVMHVKSPSDDNRSENMCNIRDSEDESNMDSTSISRFRSDESVISAVSSIIDEVNQTHSCATGSWAHEK